MTIGNGSANSYVTTDGNGKMTAVGVTITDGALTSLGQMDTMFELAMPTGVTTEFKSLMLDYATHDPAPYNHPHVDPHFFLIDMNARMNIMNDLDTTKPMMMSMPSGYMQMGDSAEEMMGTHWMDMTSPEWNGQPFVTTFDYGFTKGAMAFMEVMCDKSSLDGKKNISNSVKQPTLMSGMSMSFPSKYSITYDANAKSTKIELSGF